ncbi:hypothetical protein SLEP1_g38362 [Rubroshorea leprosula]|nr:hypothetical protein SLEP1_g38362 [Rubroshorea leprosula]
MNKGDNAWQLTAATLVGLQSVSGLLIQYGRAVKKKWAVNSAFMVLYAFACVLVWFFFKMGIIDSSGGWVIHLSSGVTGFTAAYWSGRVGAGFRQIGVQLLGILFVVIINIVSTTLICLLVQLVVPPRMSEEDIMEIGDEAAYGEETYATWGSRRQA